MVTNTSTNANQYQMTDLFALCVLNFLKNNKIKVSDLANALNIETYMLKKILDRKIKMHCYLSLLEKIAEYTQVQGIGQLGEPQKTKPTKYKIYV